MSASGLDRQVGYQGPSCSEWVGSGFVIIVVVVALLFYSAQDCADQIQ